MSAEEYIEIPALEAIERFSLGEEVEWCTQMICWTKMDGSGSLVSYFDGHKFRIRKAKPKPKLEPRDLALWWVNETGTTRRQQINSFRDTEIETESWEIVISNHKEVDDKRFSQDPQLPLDQWLSLAQVADLLGKTI